MNGLYIAPNAAGHSTIWHRSGPDATTVLVRTPYNTSGFDALAQLIHNHRRQLDDKHYGGPEW